jgi:DNA-binding transcriptional LysR family regulator
VLPRACRLAGFEPIVAFRSDDRVAVEGLVAAGVGVALIPQLTLPSARRDMVVRPLEATGLSRRVRAALPPGAYRPPAATAMLQVLAEVCQGLVVDATRRLDRPAPRQAGGDHAAADAPTD